jgi:hypothetical protein
VLANLFEVENEVREFAEANIQETQIENIENDRTYLILKELLEYYNISDETKEYHLDELIPYLKERMNFGEKNPERVVGWHLTNLNIFEKGRDGKGITYNLNKKQILIALISRGYPIPEKYQEIVKQLHNTTQTTKTTTTTETTQNNVVNEVNVINVVKNTGDKPVTISFIKDTPAFMDLTGNEIGGFTSGTTAVLHKDIAKILIEDNQAIISGCQGVVKNGC